MAIIHSKKRADELDGTSDPVDWIYGYGGNDKIYGYGSDDYRV